MDQESKDTVFYQGAEILNSSDNVILSTDWRTRTLLLAEAAGTALWDGGPWFIGWAVRTEF